jgi:hypothetical protein
MLCEPGLTIVAVDEAVHGLVCPINLDLDESSLVTATLLAQEESLVLVALGFDLLVVPICPFLPHSIFLKLISLHLEFLAGNFASVHLDKILRAHFFAKEEAQGSLVTFIL